jgi:p-hydroxybenzoate 3-monooxygenase
MKTHTQVAIVGAGPAGLLLGRLLHLAGIENVILEQRSRKFLEDRIRAGLLEHATVEVLQQAGVDDRLRREGDLHEGFEVRFDGTRTRIPMSELPGGRTTVLYPQQEVVKDLLAARDITGDRIDFEVSDVRVMDLDSNQPGIGFRDTNDVEQELRCDFIAGCDGFHGVCRPSIPDGVLKSFPHDYPFAWLGVLADAAPNGRELIYAHHRNGFAMQSLRSPTISRLYLQVPPSDSVEHWSDERIWTELQTRLAIDGDWKISEGPVLYKNLNPMRSFVTEPLQYGNLFLAGDAAHIVPPTAAKGLNLAVSDITVLSDGLVTYYKQGDRSVLDAYSGVALRRIWRAQEFSRSMTSLLHYVPGEEFEARLQHARLAGLVSSEAALKAFCEVYGGLPFEGRNHHASIKSLV